VFMKCPNDRRAERAHAKQHKRRYCTPPALGAAQRPRLTLPIEASSNHPADWIRRCLIEVQLLQHHTQTGPATRTEHNERVEYDGAMYRRQASAHPGERTTGVHQYCERLRTSTKQTLSRSARKEIQLAQAQPRREMRSSTPQPVPMRRVGRSVPSAPATGGNETEEGGAHIDQSVLNRSAKKNVRRALGSATTWGARGSNGTIRGLRL
jgi:hypothetical protein